jgi:murein DD-endopeptidase MepM/ murein hydrolase activator NlpD
METLLLLTNLLWPVNGPITQYPSQTHQAVDIACSVGAPVVAAHDGIVAVSRSGGVGNVVTVTGTTYVSEYAHLNTTTQAFYVLQGEEIGTCGNTGRLTTGPHLHFSLRYVANLGASPR